MVEIEKIIRIYDYYEHVEKDVRDLIKEKEQDKSWRLSWYIHERDGKRYFNFPDAVEDLQSICWNDDSVTGNASGSYTMDTVQAERNLVGNWDLLNEALTDFGDDKSKIFINGAEWCDVMVRCHIVDNVVNDVLSDYQEKHGLYDLPLEDGGSDIDPDSLPM